MTPLFARWAAMKQAVRCLLAQHEYSTEAPVTEKGEPTGVLRQRCLHCTHVTEGWDTTRVTRYRRTHEADRARLVLHNGKLRRCPCAACEDRRRQRRQRPVVTRIKGAA